MNTQQVKSFLMWLLAFVGGFVVSKGWFSAGTYEIIAGAIVAAIVSAWDIRSNTRTNQIATVAKSQPDIIITMPTKAEADKIPGENVIGEPAFPKK